MYLFSQIVEEPQFFDDGIHNLTRLWLTFAGQKIYVEKEVKSYSVASFVADCGGLLGLFIGFNFLMILDVFVFMYRKFRFIFYKKYMTHS